VGIAGQWPHGDATARRRPVTALGLLVLASGLVLAALLAGNDQDGSASVELRPEQLSGAAGVADDAAASGGSYLRLAGRGGQAAEPRQGVEVRPVRDLRLTARGAGVSLAQVVLTTDLRCVPAGGGNNCT